EAGGDPARVLTHVDHDLAVDGAARLDPEHLAELTRMERDGELTATQAKQVLADMVEHGQDPRSAAAARGFEAMGRAELAQVIDAVIADNPQEWQEFVEG